jgi:hypothetical protein
MTSDNEQDKSNTSPPNPPISTNIAPDGLGDSGNSNISAEESTHQDTRPEDKQIVVNVIQSYIPETGGEANGIARDANDIAKASTKVNTGLLVVTVVLALISTLQYISSDSAAKTAEKTFQETTKHDSITLANQKIADDNAEKALNRKTRHDDSVFKLQITALEATSQQFEVQNEPYLQFTEVRIDSATIGKPYYIKYILANIGNYPVKILNTDFYDAIRSTDAGIQNIKSNNGKNFAGDYIVKGNPIIFLRDVPEKIVTQKNINKILGDGYFWTSGIIKYQNLVSHRIKSYEFNIKVKLNGVFISTYNVNSYVK